MAGGMTARLNQERNGEFFRARRPMKMLIAETAFPANPESCFGS
jgi:hypothetical protein